MSDPDTLDPTVFELVTNNAQHIEALNRRLDTAESRLQHLDDLLACSLQALEKTLEKTKEPDRAARLINYRQGHQATRAALTRYLATLQAMEPKTEGLLGDMARTQLDLDLCDVDFKYKLNHFFPGEDP